MDDSDAEDGPAETNGGAPTKLLLFGGETVNLDSGDRMCTNDCLIYDTEYNVWYALLSSPARCPCAKAHSPCRWLGKHRPISINQGILLSVLLSGG